MIRVLVAGTSAVVRAGLEAVVRTNADLELAGSYSTDRVADELEHTTADVLLIELPHLNEEWITSLAGVAIPVVALTEVSEMETASPALRAGVRAILSADAGATEILAAIIAAAAGLIALQPSLLDFFGPEARTPATSISEEALSPREIEVLGLMAEGLSNKLIAHQLGISEHTVKFHVASILGKLHAGSRTDAVMQGIRRGILLV